MPANGRWDLIRRLKVNNPTIYTIERISWTAKYLLTPNLSQKTFVLFFSFMGPNLDCCDLRILRL